MTNHLKIASLIKLEMMIVIHIKLKSFVKWDSPQNDRLLLNYSHMFFVIIIKITE